MTRGRHARRPVRRPKIRTVVNRILVGLAAYVLMFSPHQIGERESDQ